MHALSARRGRDLALDAAPFWQTERRLLALGHGRPGIHRGRLLAVAAVAEGFLTAPVGADERAVLRVTASTADNPWFSPPEAEIRRYLTTALRRPLAERAVLALHRGMMAEEPVAVALLRLAELAFGSRLDEDGVWWCEPYLAGVRARADELAARASTRAHRLAWERWSPQGAGRFGWAPAPGPNGPRWLPSMLVDRASFAEFVWARFRSEERESPERAELLLRALEAALAEVPS